MDIQKAVTTIVLVIVGFVVIFYIVGSLAPTLSTAAGNISGSGLPLSGIFTANGPVIIVLMAAIMIGLIMAALRFFKHK